MSNRGGAWDVAVIGAGVFGAWTAWYARQSGRRVILLDAHGPANSRASSAGEARVIRMSYGADEIYTRMAARSMRVWREFFAEIREPLFRRTGVLVTAKPSSPYLRATRETLQRVGIHHEWIEGHELRKRFPGMRLAPARAGVFEPESGALMARRATQAVVRHSGAEYRDDQVLPPRGAGIRTARGEQIRAGAFVFACGPWLPKLFPALLAGRIRPSRQEEFFFGPRPGDTRFSPPELPIWIDFDEGAYAIPDLDGRGFKVAVDKHGPPIDPETGSRALTLSKYREVRAVLGRRFPSMKHAPLLESRVCQYENTSNGDFLIDRHPDFDNVWLVGGGSGHGFKHGPAVGQYVLSRLEGRGTPEPRFSLVTKGSRRRRTVY